MAQPPATTEKPIGPKHICAFAMAAVRYALGKSPTATEALAEGVSFANAAEARFPGIHEALRKGA